MGAFRMIIREAPGEIEIDDCLDGTYEGQKQGCKNCYYLRYKGI